MSGSRLPRRESRVWPDMALQGSIALPERRGVSTALQACARSRVFRRMPTLLSAQTPVVSAHSRNPVLHSATPASF